MSGDTVFSTTHPYEPRTIPTPVVKATVERIAGTGFTEEEVRAAAHIPSAYPPGSEVRVVPFGSVWVAREAIPNQPQLWNVFSEQGTLQASVKAPPGFEIRCIEQNAVWGLVLDELDVPFLVKRPILQGQNSSGE